MSKLDEDIMKEDIELLKAYIEELRNVVNICGCSNRDLPVFENYNYDKLEALGVL